MSRARSPRLECLEARELLSGLRHATARAARPLTPVVLNGTLNVYPPEASTTVAHSDGSSSVSIPVSGQLDTVGPVQGMWQVTLDSSGNHGGLDSLNLRTSKGTLTIQFNNQNPVSLKKASGPVSHKHQQHLTSGTGAYARSTERGTLELISNATRTRVVTMTLRTRGT